MDLRSALKGAGASRFTFAPGDVCTVDDKKVVLPPTPNEKRKWHGKGRTCIILSRASLCDRTVYPIVSIAPTSTQIDLKEETDLEIVPNESNGLNERCLVMLGHIQPVRKADLFKKIGTLTADEWDAVCAHLLWCFDLQD
jgi:mRNA-degrading endonuclease toxin of MazEF toxin-antitoxin module